MVPQYYGVPTPWGLYPAAGILQQQQGGPGTPQGGQQTPQALTPQQILRGQRPVTPQGSEAVGTPSSGVQAPGVGTPGMYCKKCSIIIGDYLFGEIGEFKKFAKIK